MAVEPTGKSAGSIAIENGSSSWRIQHKRKENSKNRKNLSDGNIVCYNVQGDPKNKPVQNYTGWPKIWHHYAQLHQKLFLKTLRK